MDFTYKPTHHFVVREIVDEVILVPVSPQSRQKNEMLVLNDTAAFFYQCAREGLSKRRILERAQEEFAAEAPEILAGLEDFLREMETREVLLAQPTTGE